MPRDWQDERNGDLDPDGLERRVEKLVKINAVLMDRVERSMDQQGNAFSLFQTAIGLDAKVRSRTEELTAVLRRLECSNEALIEAKDEAERANLSKTRFLAAASHDLLQPLNAARLSISVLSELQKSDDARRLAGRVDQSLQTIEDLIKTLLDISKLDAGVVTPDFQFFPLDEVLTRLEASFAPLAGAKQLTFDVLRSGLLVHSDPLLLQRVLQNLISNAVRYTKQGGVSVSVLRRGSDCLIDVVDTGCGISENERETMFEEFYRGTAAAKSDHAGLGLGLSIVQRTVQALGHGLEVEFDPRQGVDLPADGGLCRPCTLGCVHANDGSCRPGCHARCCRCYDRERSAGPGGYGRAARQMVVPHFGRYPARGIGTGSDRIGVRAGHRAGGLQSRRRADRRRRCEGPARSVRAEPAGCCGHG